MYPRIQGKALIRVTRNADIDADALYDEDLDYREFMADLMKQRRKLAPIRLEMSGDLDIGSMLMLDNYLGLEEKYVFSFWEKVDEGRTAVRICTSWATRDEAVEELIADLKNLG